MSKSSPTEIESPRRLRLPRSRALAIDVLHYYRRVPTCAHDRLCDLSRIVELRKRSPRRISWSVLFIKAFGIVATKSPQLRQSWMQWPWPHLYQHPHSVGMLATHREFRGEAWLFWSRFNRPEAQPLTTLQDKLERYQREPVERIFKQQFLFSGLPTPLRRMIWWWNLNVSGPKRAKRTGTFFLTTLAARGAEIQHPPAFLTSNMTYGPLDENNRSRVTIAYDHRLMDGMLVADCLAEMEAALNGSITDELEAMIRQADGSEQIEAA